MTTELTSAARRTAAVADWGLGERGFKAKKDSVRAATIRRESSWLTGRFDHYKATRAPADLPPSLYLAWSSPGWEKDPGWVLTKDSAVPCVS